MPRLEEITIENFRSIGEDPIRIKFHQNMPITFVGENNAGKSNIIRSIELMFGEFHPKYKNLEDFDFFNRVTSNKIDITTIVSGFRNRMGRAGEYSCGGFHYSYVKGHDSSYCAIQAENGEENQYVSNNLRDELLCVTVNSEQNLSFQLS